MFIICLLHQVCTKPTSALQTCFWDMSWALQRSTGSHHGKVAVSSLNYMCLERTAIPLARGEQSQQLNHGTSKLAVLCKSSAQQLPGIVMVSKTDQSHLIMSHFICATSVRKLVKTRLTGYSASQASNQIKRAVAQLLAIIIFTHDTAFNYLWLGCQSGITGRKDKAKNPGEISYC